MTVLKLRRICTDDETPEEGESRLLNMVKGFEDTAGGYHQRYIINEQIEEKLFYLRPRGPSGEKLKPAWGRSYETALRKLAAKNTLSLDACNQLKKEVIISIKYTLALYLLPQTDGGVADTVVMAGR